MSIVVKSIGSELAREAVVDLHNALIEKDVSDIAERIDIVAHITMHVLHLVTEITVEIESEKPNEESVETSVNVGGIVVYFLKDNNAYVYVP